MNIFRNTLGIIIGVIVGSIVNMMLVMYGPTIIPAPEGVDVTNVESIAQSLHLFEPKHFLFPFLAHAIGTLVGALIAYLIAATLPIFMAFVVGVIFLAGGISASFVIPAPVWFIAVDLLFAYLPMAWLAIQLARVFKPS